MMELPLSALMIVGNGNNNDLPVHSVFGAFKCLFGCILLMNILFHSLPIWLISFYIIHL